MNHVALVDSVGNNCHCAHTLKRGMPHLFALWGNDYAAVRIASSDKCIDTRRDPIRYSRSVYKENLCLVFQVISK